jgi:outer membrane receptor for ferrienterochelin and colicin
MCYCNPNLKPENSCNKAIQWMKLRYKEQQFLDLKTIYLNQLKNKKCTESNRNQIEKDVLRTYPNSEFFKQRKV